jgi:hypothetical protein
VAAPKREKTERLKRIEPRIHERQPPFEQRLRLISEQYGVELATLGTEAGLSRETISQWIIQARGGAACPGFRSSHEKLATRWRVPLEWLRSSAPLPLGSKLPEPEQSEQDMDAELLALLRRAVEILERKARR